jgi:hypothetical protein
MIRVYAMEVISVMDVSQMSSGMTWGIGLVWLLVLVPVVLRIAALIKYLRT